MHTITDKVTATTFAVVKGRIPAELLAGLESDFTSEEIEHIFARINKTLAQPPTGQPMALWVFGPSAVGKSTLGNAKAIELFGYVQNAVMIDGGEFRLHHAGFCAIAIALRMKPTQSYAVRHSTHYSNTINPHSPVGAPCPG